MDITFLQVDPGICGFSCLIRAERLKRRSVHLQILGSECKMICSLSKNLPEISMPELFIPVTKNPIFLAAEKAGCHLSCPIPTALVKAAEIALELALPKEVRISLIHQEKEATHEKN